jgi:2-oxo-4-hydroxy-4-carboxy-5-ureidoimidazoline decarboxylase
MAYSFSTLNQMSQADFTQALGGIFEQTPTIPAQAWQKRPFSSIDDLYQNMRAVVEAFTPDQMMALICAHPDLGSQAKMAHASVKEQSGAGLDRLTAEEYEQFWRLNNAYRTRFGFPFIIAVRGHTKTTILDSFAQRIQNSAADELNQAIFEIEKIAKLRLIDAIDCETG